MRQVKLEDLSKFSMVAGGEKRITKVIDGDELKEWVGIGWVSIGKATKADRKKFPVVKRTA